MLVTSVELVQVETELYSLKTDVMMTANRYSDLTFSLLIIIIFAIIFILNQFYNISYYNYIAIRTLAM